MEKKGRGRGIDNNGTSLLFSFEGNNVDAVLKKPKESLLEWFKTVGDLHYKVEPKNKIIGEIRIGNETLLFNINKKK